MGRLSFVLSRTRVCVLPSPSTGPGWVGKIFSDWFLLIPFNSFYVTRNVEQFPEELWAKVQRSRHFEGHKRHPADFWQYCPSTIKQSCLRCAAELHNKHTSMKEIACNRSQWSHLTSINENLKRNMHMYLPSTAEYKRIVEKIKPQTLD